MARIIGGADGAICEGPLSVGRAIQFVDTSVLLGRLPLGDLSTAVNGFGPTSRIFLRSFGASGGSVSVVGLGRGRGTFAVPTGALNGDSLGLFGGLGWTPSFGVGPWANVQFFATEDQTAANRGSRIDLAGILNGGGTARSGLQVFPSIVVDDTDITVFDVTAAALKRVSRGIADSGGVGFRLLRIPN